MIIATAGHIDHGKTVLVRALTGVDTDRLPEEKVRGLSIDLGFAYQPLDNGATLGFIDVPGHEKFVRNMLAGVTGIDFALLVIAADDGPMPQTEEHLAILDLLGIEFGAIALTKIDRVDKNRLSEVQEEIGVLVADTIMEDAPLFPCSGQTGEGISPLKAYLHEAANRSAGQSAHGQFRLAVDRTFNLTGAGLIVTGTVFSGSAEVGDRLVISPKGLPARIRSIHAQDQESQTGSVGQRCALNLTGTGVDRAAVKRGDWVLDGGVHAPTNRFDGLVRVLASEQRPLRHWTSVHLHVGAKDVTGRVAMLEDWHIDPRQEGLVQLVLDEQIGAVRGDRLILRDQSARRTVAGGIVLDPFSPQQGRRKPERIEFLRALMLDDSGDALRALLDAQPGGVDLGRFQQTRNLNAGEAEEIWRSVDMIKIGKSDQIMGVAEQAWSKIKDSILAELRNWHTKWPERPGPEDERLRRSLPLAIKSDILNAALLEMIKNGEVQRDGPSIALPGHRPEFEGKDAALWQQIGRLLVTKELRPPRTRELAAEIGVALKQIENLLNRAASMGLVYRVADNRYFLPETLLELAEIAERVAAKSADGMFDAKKYRDATTIGRNVAIEVLEFFDKQKFCKRLGDQRTIERPAREIFIV
ncbi:MAG: selenocysteine-specific translation elongation factor [Rhodospirillaceae bacterium]|mgnify:CR=1 FL=1|nr:selenocysteine-specific translation elongation factor [Rhodospirillaceae bacterium]